MVILNGKKMIPDHLINHILWSLFDLLQTPGKIIHLMDL